MSTWIKVDDALPHNPKVLHALSLAGAEAAWLYVAGLCYCGKSLSDGHIPAWYVTSVPGVKQPTKTTRALVQSSLWLVVDGGYQVRDYLEWNASRAEVDARREHAREKKAGQRFGGQHRSVPSSSVRPSPGSSPILSPGDNEGDRQGDDLGTDGGTDAEQDGGQRDMSPGESPHMSRPRARVQTSDLQIADSRQTERKNPIWPAAKASGVHSGSEVDQVLEHWALTLYPHRRPKFDTKRRNKVRDRLAEGFSVEDLRLAVNGCAASEFHREHGHRDIELICRDAQHVESFLGRATGELPSSPEADSPAPPRQLVRASDPSPGVPPPPEFVQAYEKLVAPSAPKAAP